MLESGISEKTKMMEAKGPDGLTPSATQDKMFRSVYQCRSEHWDSTSASWKISPQGGSMYSGPLCISRPERVRGNLDIISYNLSAEDVEWSGEQGLSSEHKIFVQGFWHRQKIARSPKIPSRIAFLITLSTFYVRIL